MRRYLGPRCVECYLLFVTLISPGPCDLCYKIQKQSFCSLISYKKPKSFLNAILTLKIAKSFLIYKKLLAKNSHLRNFSGHLTQGSYLLKKQKFSRNFFYLEYLTGQKNAKNSHLRNFSGHLTYGSNLFKKLIILRNFILSLKPKETGLNFFS